MSKSAHFLETANSLFLKMLLFLVLLFVPTITNAAELELTSSSLCEVCHCGPGPGMNPKEKALCQNIGDGKRIKVVSLPHFVTSLVVENATGGVVLMRGAVRVNNDGDTSFRLVINKASHFELSEKSITLLGSESEAHVSIEKVENVNFAGRAVSASKPGRFALRVSHSGTVSIDSRTFDVLNDVIINDVKSLRLSSSAFKPNVPLQTPEMTILIERVGSIPQLPTDVFSSGLSISMIDCNISEIESSAFSGFSVINITFVRSNIDRVHSRAFPEKSLLNRLLFENCSLTSVAEKAISSAMSSLEVRFSALSSLSEEAIFSHVAKVEFSDNNFQTLSHRSFVFQSWTSILFNSNRIMFMESGSLLGIDLPGEVDSGDNVTFSFSDNNIHYANQDALKVSIPATVEAIITDNVFYKYCECGLNEWLTIVCGSVKNDGSLLDMNSLLQNSSQCQVAELARPCFQANMVKMTVFIEKFCSTDNNDISNNIEETSNDKNGENFPPCVLIDQMTPWELFRQHIEVTTNRGILLLLLLFALACSLGVAFLTLIRWIVFTIKEKTKCHKSQEWNFTKIEERGRDTSGSEHYENLPLTTAECFDSSPTTGEQTEENPTSLSVESDDDEGEGDVKGDEVTKEQQNETTHTTLEAERCKSPPKPTFYDEMICLLQEKLDDPNNYGTVADSATTCFYQDPQDLQK